MEQSQSSETVTQLASKLSGFYGTHHRSHAEPAESSCVLYFHVLFLFFNGIRHKVIGFEQACA
jgi:hypothetical protein